MTLAGQVATCPYNAAFESTFIDLCREEIIKLLLEPKYHSHKTNEASCSWVGTGRDLSCLHNQCLFVLFQDLHFTLFEIQIFDTKQAFSFRFRGN